MFMCHASKDIKKNNDKSCPYIKNESQGCDGLKVLDKLSKIG